MGVENTGHRHLHFPLLFLGSLQSSFSFLQVKVSIILPGKLSNLDKEVPQMILEPRNVLIEVKQPRHCDLYLIVCQVREGSLKEVCYKTLQNLKKFEMAQLVQPLLF